MLYNVDCNKNNYEKLLFSLVHKGVNENNKRIKLVASIIHDVKKNGNKALFKYSKKYDKKIFKKPQDILVSKEEILEASKLCTKEFKNSIRLAIKRIKNYQKRLMPKSLFFKDSLGVNLGCIWSPLSSCCLYVPGGKALYPSSVLMNAIPAQVAGVKRIAIVTPTINDKVNPEILIAAKEANISEIYKVGGAQAIAALTFGTETIKKVDKIVGPGNAYVAEAKKQVYGYVGIDSIAGPSEILIIADESSNPEWVAMDLLSQAEHDEEARCILVSNSQRLIEKVNYYLKYFLNTITRKKIAEKSLKDNGFSVFIKNIDDAHLIANYIAPEHLEIMTKNKNILAKKINNAGAIFIGDYTPEAFGDYIAGPSHVLPTSGNARFDSGLSVLDFLKRTSYIKSNKNSLKSTLKTIEVIGNSEGLDAHVKSAQIRFSKE